MTIDDAIAAARMVKELGTSSKVPLPLNLIIPALEDAKKWREAPQVVQGRYRRSAAVTDRCFKHPRRKAAHQWKVCSDGRWHGVCVECDLELNRIGLEWAYPMTWRPKFEAYKRKVMEAAE